MASKHFRNSPEEEIPHATEQEVEKAIIECLRIAARRGRQLREERERLARGESATPPETFSHLKKDWDLHYDLIPREQALDQILSKYKSGELPISKMSNKELVLFGEASHKETENLLWNIKQHELFLKRLDGIAKHLNDAERRRISEMLSATKWSERELTEVKNIIENAVWFSHLPWHARERE